MGTTNGTLNFILLTILNIKQLYQYILFLR